MRLSLSPARTVVSFDDNSKIPGKTKMVSPAWATLKPDSIELKGLSFEPFPLLTSDFWVYHPQRDCRFFKSKKPICYRVVILNFIWI